MPKALIVGAGIGGLAAALSRMPASEMVGTLLFMEADSKEVAQKGEMC